MMSQIEQNILKKNYVEGNIKLQKHPQTLQLDLETITLNAKGYKIRN